MDDAYIVAHNAQVLHWGHDPNYAGTSPLAGTTSAIHLALVAAALFILPPPWALEAIAGVAAVASALGIAHLAKVRGIPHR